MVQIEQLLTAASQIAALRIRILAHRSLIGVLDGHLLPLGL